MTYSKLLFYFLLPILVLTFLVLFVRRGSIVYFEKKFFYTALFTYATWWIADFIGIQSKLWIFDTNKLFGIWFGGLPLEDHLIFIFLFLIARNLSIIFF